MKKDTRIAPPKVSSAAILTKLKNLIDKIANSRDEFKRKMMTLKRGSGDTSLSQDREPSYYSRACEMLDLAKGVRKDIVTALYEKMKVSSDAMVWAASAVATEEENEQLRSRLQQVETECASLRAENQRLNEEKEIDPMTGFLVVSAFRKRLVHYISDRRRRDDRGRFSAAIWMMDINNFKLINDTYGYDVGDNAIRRFAWRLRERSHIEFVEFAKRRSDIIIARGGDKTKSDEFWMFVPIPNDDMSAELKVGVMSEHIIRPDNDEAQVPEDCRLPEGVIIEAATGLVYCEEIPILSLDQAAIATEKLCRKVVELEREQKKLRNIGVRADRISRSFFM